MNSPKQALARILDIPVNAPKQWALARILHIPVNAPKPFGECP